MVNNFQSSLPLYSLIKFKLQKLEHGCVELVAPLKDK